MVDVIFASNSNQVPAFIQNATKKLLIYLLVVLNADGGFSFTSFCRARWSRTATRIYFFCYNVLIIPRYLHADVTWTS